MKLRLPTFSERIAGISVLTMLGIIFFSWQELSLVVNVIFVFYVSGMVSMLISTGLILFFEKEFPEFKEFLFVDNLGPMNFSLSLFTVLLFVIGFILRYWIINYYLIP